MKRSCSHLVAIVILTLSFPVLGTVHGPTGWAGLVASADRPPRGSVHALFDLNAPVTGPFPSDWFTMADTSHNTGRRVSLPMPDCETRRSDCEDIAVLNALDGFNLQPRLSVPFSGSIDANSVTSDTVFLVSLGSTLSDQGYMPPGTVVGINQVVWDTFTTTLHIESNALLAQHTRFALIVTRGVRDDDGAPVEASEAFRRFRQIVRGEYKQALLAAIQAARQRRRARAGYRGCECVQHAERDGRPGKNARPNSRSHTGAGGLPPGAARGADGLQPRGTDRHPIRPADNSRSGGVHACQP